MAAKIKEHGIGIAIKRNKKRLFAELVMVGKLKHTDYEMFVPIIDKALKEVKELEVDLLIDMREFKGWEMLAAWDDMKFGLKYGNRFDKMALIGDKKWEEVSVNMMDHLFKGEAKFFKTRDKALAWLIS